MNCLYFKISKLFFPALTLLLFIQNSLPVQASDKPIFVEISTQWCYACNLLKPTIEELKNQYSSKVDFLLLDATSEETINSARQLASQYGINDYFDANRNVFPKVAIICPNSITPEKVIVGANPKDAYIKALGEVLSGDISICSSDGRPKENKSLAGRPETPNIIDRPIEVNFPDRAKEVTFWEVGDQIPYYSYFQFVQLPECANNTSVLCYHRDDGAMSQTNNEQTTEPTKEKNLKGLKVEKKK